jgi:hypothetical protein
MTFLPSIPKALLAALKALPVSRGPSAPSGLREVRSTWLPQSIEWSGLSMS